MVRLVSRTILVLACGMGLVSPFQAQPQNTVFNQAFTLYQAGSLAEAQALLVAAVKGRPSALDLSLLGTIEVQQGDLKSAEEHIRKALTIEPGLKGARMTLATVLETEGKLADAQKALEKLIAVDSRNVQALLALARVQNREGNTEAALASGLKAKAVAPGDPAVLYAVGALCLQMDLIKDGTETLEHAAALDPNPTTLYALASARVANRDLTAAIKIYGDLLRSEPGNPQLNYALGATHFIGGENDLAKPYFERSIQLQPDQVESFYYLGIIADEEGNKEKGARMLTTAIERQPSHARAHLALGQLYRSQGRLEEARQELETATRLSPDSQKAHYQLGLLLTALKQQDAAKKELEMAKQLRTSSDDRVSWRLLPHP